MGYCISINEQEFLIRRENAKGALKALKDLTRSKSLRWVCEDNIIGSDTLEEAMEEVRYSICKDANGDWIIDYFNGEKTW